MNSIMDYLRGVALRVKKAWNRLFHKAGEDGLQGAPSHGGQKGETRLFDARALKKEQIRAEHGAHENEPLFVDRERRRPFILSLLFTTIRFVLIGFVLLGFAALGAGIGVAKAYVETTPTLDRAQLTKSKRSSFLYDKDGALITTIADVEYRDWVDIEAIPVMLQNAFVSVEDIRFYKHNGVDIKRLFSAMLEVLGNSNASGGSTITQQLIKNKILGNERTYRRKIQEAYLALELEKEIGKPEILEAYLNDIHLGEGNYGVKTAAKDYFGKELNELTIRECALLAGLTQNPNAYNPRLNTYKRDASYLEDTINRTNKVLGNMYKAGYIDLREYQDALKEEVYIVEFSEQRKLYDMPYFVEYAIRDVVLHMLKQRELPNTPENRAAVENELRTSGYHIYTTVDREMQNLVQETLSNWDKYPQLLKPTNDTVIETLSNGEVFETKQPQSSAVVIDYHTGELRVIVGGRYAPTIRKGFNRAYQAYMEVGSSIKPLAVYGPAFDAGASPATIIGNFPAPVEGWTKSPGYPYIGADKHIGPLSIRQGIVSSLNVMAARTLMEWVTPQVGAQYLLNMNAYPDKINADGPGLALGTSGLTTIQMAAAFGTLAAEGEYKEPISFTKVVDGAGNIILDATKVQGKKQVYKPSTAYMLVDVLKEAVQAGTGKNAKIPNMTVAGKTGTNADYRSVYFAGMTPYYSAAVWIGHDYPESSFLRKGATGGDYAAPLWQSFMKEIHEGLPNKDIIDTPPSTLGLVKKTVCGISGLLPTDACYADKGGHAPITDWFLDENAPTQTCDMHAAVALCSESGMVATNDCPTTGVVDGSVVLIAPGSYYDQFTDEELSTGLNNYIRTSVPLESYVENLSGYYNRCVIHGYGYYGGGTGGDEISGVQELEDREYSLEELKKIGNALRNEILQYIRNTRLPSDSIYTLQQHAEKINQLTGGFNKDMLQKQIQQTQWDYKLIKEDMLYSSGVVPE